MIAGRSLEFNFCCFIFYVGEGVGMVGRVAALMPFVCAIRVGLVAGAVGAGVVGRAPRATETTGREAVAVLETNIATRLAAG